jgi:hypothetical protein
VVGEPSSAAEWICADVPSTRSPRSSSWTKARAGLDRRF